MKKRFSFFALFLLLLLACESVAAPAPTPSPPPTSTPKPPPTLSAGSTVIPLTPACRSAQPTGEDIDRALSFTGRLFSPDEWKRTYTVSENRVMVSWVYENKLAYLEALIYPCGYEEPDINAYYSDENWGTIFANYESYQPAEKCRTDSGLRLYLFSAQNLGFEYDVRYWAQSDTDDRLIGLMLVFPVEERALLEEYSARLFASLPTCP